MTTYSEIHPRNSISQEGEVVLLLSDGEAEPPRKRAPCELPKAQELAVRGRLSCVLPRPRPGGFVLPFQFQGHSREPGPHVPPKRRGGVCHFTMGGTGPGGVWTPLPTWPRPHGLPRLWPGPPQWRGIAVISVALVPWGSCWEAFLAPSLTPLWWHPEPAPPVAPLCGPVTPQQPLISRGWQLQAGPTGI